MRRLIALLVTTPIAILLCAGTQASGATKIVDVGDDFFDPASLVIKENNTIDFVWVGENEHNVFRETGPGKYFESKTHEGSGYVFSRKFRKPGNYTFGCILHPDMDMDLKVKRRRR